MEAGKKIRFTALAVIAVAYTPLLWLHFRRLWSSEQYQTFPLVLAMVAVLFWTRFRPKRSNDAPLETAMGLRSKWLIGALITLAAAVILWSPWLATLSFVVLSYHALHFLAGESDQSPIPIWALLLLLLLPLPLGWDERLIFWVQGIASHVGSSLLDFFAVNHLLSGHVLQVPGREFPVQDVCGGMSSFFSLVALAAVLAVYLRRPLIHAALLLFAGAFWAAIIGAIRLTCVVLLHVRHAVDVSSGLERHLLGIGSFLLATGMLFCSDRFLLVLLAPIPDELDHDDLDNNYNDITGCDDLDDHESADVAACHRIAANTSTKFVMIVASCFASPGLTHLLARFAAPRKRDA